MKIKTMTDYRETLLKDLENPKEAAAYLNAALEQGEEEYFLVALRNVAEARGGLRRISGKARLNRQSLYRTLSKAGNPELKSLGNILDALGMKLAVEPKARKLGSGLSKFLPTRQASLHNPMPISFPLVK